MRLREERSLAAAVRLAGPFVLNFQVSLQQALLRDLVRILDQGAVR